MAEWKFIPKHDELMVSKQWLKLYPEDGILAPGESTTITATIYFSVDWIANLQDESKTENGVVRTYL